MRRVGLVSLISCQVCVCWQQSSLLSFYVCVCVCLCVGVRMLSARSPSGSVARFAFCFHCPMRRMSDVCDICDAPGSAACPLSLAQYLAQGLSTLFNVSQCVIESRLVAVSPGQLLALCVQ